MNLKSVMTTANRRDKILRSPARELQESYVELRRLRKLVEKAEKRRINLGGSNPSGRGQPMKTADDLELAPKFEKAALEKIQNSRPTSKNSQRLTAGWRQL